MEDKLMKNILTEIVEKKKEIVAQDKRMQSLYDVKQQLKPGEFRMSHKIKKNNWSLIAECKLQSPAKGRICTKYSIVELAKVYEQNGASILSVHTDPHFLGKNEDIQRVRAVTDLPVLRKDFIIDEYQIYQARQLGADAILLIARILSPAQLKEYVYTAWNLGLDVLVEVHDEADIKSAENTPAEFIGVNNRNLSTFKTDIQNTIDLISYCDRERTLISESGIHDGTDVERLQQAGISGILVGESLVRADDIGRKTRELSLQATLQKVTA